MMLFYSKTRKIKYFLDPPPPKRLRDTNDGDMHNSCEYTHCVGLLAIVPPQPTQYMYVYSQLHAQVFVYTSSP